MRSSRSVADPLDPGSAGFAHRGLHGPGVPENSMAAFRAAMEAGAGIECDVRLSADGEVMVFHDPDLRRICSLPLEFEATEAAFLAGQRLAGTGETIPRLFDLLDLVGGRVPLLIELKTRNGNAGRLAAAVAAALARYDGPVGVMSFDPEAGRELKRDATHLRRGLVISDRASALRRWHSMAIASPHFLAIDFAAVRRGWVARSRSARQVYCWTIRTAANRETAAVHADALIWESDGRPRI